MCRLRGVFWNRCYIDTGWFCIAHTSICRISGNFGVCNFVDSDAEEVTRNPELGTRTPHPGDPHFLLNIIQIMMGAPNNALMVLMGSV